VICDKKAGEVAEGNFAVFAGFFVGVAGKPRAERGVFVVKMWWNAW
jgi:hypothetical protein